MAITSFTIGGVEVDPIYQTFEIRETEGGVSTLTCDIESSGSPVQRFSVHQAIAVVEDGTTIFAGTVTQTRERGFGGPNIYDVDTDAPQIVTTITAEDYSRLAERVYVTETFAAGTTLATALATVVTYLSDLGVSLSGSQATGPDLPEMVFTKARASEVLKAFSDATGYSWRIDYDKSLRMWQPGDLTAPFDPDEDDDPAQWTGDVEVEHVLGDDYANRVIVVSEPLTEEAHVETFVGDGSTSVFDLEWTLLQHRGYVTDDLDADPDINKTLTETPYQGEADWTYHPATNTLERDLGPLPNGQTAAITFKGTFQAEATAEDAAAIAAYGLYELVVSRNDITTTAAAQALADQILADRLAAGDNIVSYATRKAVPTLRAGQAQTITAPSRNVDGTHIITELRVQAETPVTAAYDAAGVGLYRTITAKKSQFNQKWQYTYHDWLSDKTGTGTTVSVGDGGVAQVGPGGPDTAVQFNDAGRFGGHEDFTFKKATRSAFLGGDHAVVASSTRNLLIGLDHTVE